MTLEDRIVAVLEAIGLDMKVALAGAGESTGSPGGAGVFSDTTESTSTTTGAVKVAGGLGVAKSLHVGVAPDISGPGTQVAPMFFIRDMYRMQVEAASGGAQTVLYTALHQPSIVNIIPAFNMQDIDAGLGTGLHPAFVVDGVQKRELFIGTYAGAIQNGELISMPGVDPAVSLDHDAFVSAAKACGEGWHCMTNVEWAALAAWCWKNGTLPRGNSYYGTSNYAPWEVGRRQDGGAPGVPSGASRVLAGSGPARWRHDNTFSGIADLCGNILEWAPGLRLVGGEIQVVQDNNAAMTTSDLGPTASAWKAIHGSTGALITPTFTGSIAGDNYAPTTTSSVRMAVSGTASYTLVRASGQSFAGLTNPGSTPVSATALQVLKRLGLFPPASSGLGEDGLWTALTGERLAIRGGSWNLGTRAGVFALGLNYPRATAADSIGARPAFVL